MIVDLIAGARPNFMKVAAIIRAIERRAADGGRLRYRLVHTGQHYDTNLSGAFFAQLGIPAPHVNLDVGSGTQAEQTAGIMTRYERVHDESRPDACVVVGDVTSTMACAIVARKQGTPVAHVEAGIRSGDWSMPEEINRIVTDALSHWHFTTSEIANENLRRAGVEASRIHFVGNTMIDTLLANMDRLVAPPAWQELGLEERAYFVLTLHRPANVGLLPNLVRLLSAVAQCARELPVVFPAHPRTVKVLDGNSVPPNVHIIEPQPYLEFNYLVRHAKAAITDSGGITEEATVMGVPCMTLRSTTERPETVTIGTNELLGTDASAIGPSFERLFAGAWKKGGIPPKWDGKSAERIVAVLEASLG